jgi:transposase-like protein
LQHRGLKIAPKLAIGDGALGFWKVVTKLWPETRGQTYEAFDPCIDLFIPKYPKAMECFAKDKASMLFFYDDLAENWQHIRTTNPVESVFSTVRLRQPKPRIVEAWQRRWLWRLSKWKQHGKIVSAKGQQVINGCHQWH